MLAILLAGGTGSRMGADRPKQFLPLQGRMVIEHSIEAFDKAPCVDEVAVVVHPDWLDFMSEVVARNHWPKLRRLIRGGSERYMSSLNAIKAYADAPADRLILFHDAARPWVSQEIIARVGEGLQHAQAVGVGVPSIDTIWQVDPNTHAIVSVPDRSTMYRAQTPQAGSNPTGLPPLGHCRGIPPRSARPRFLRHRRLWGPSSLLSRNIHFGHPRR